MADDDTLRKFFSDVLEQHLSDFSVDDGEIQTAISQIHYAYSFNGQRMGSTRTPINYDIPAYRCAYLFKYAAAHTALVQNVTRDIYLGTSVLDHLFQQEIIHICSLGGGPGVDAIGIASAMYPQFTLNQPNFRFTVVDCMSEWKKSFQTILQVASSGQYGLLDKLLSNCVKWVYICDDLFSPGSETIQAISKADVITMVKFVSAADPERVSAMLQAVFALMKPGSLILFIDNAGGGFYEKVSQEAAVCKMETACDPRPRMFYSCGHFWNCRFGHHSLLHTTVAVHMWKKSLYSTSKKNFPLPQLAVAANFISSEKSSCNESEECDTKISSQTESKLSINKNSSEIGPEESGAEKSSEWESEHTDATNSSETESKDSGTDKSLEAESEDSCAHESLESESEDSGTDESSEPKLEYSDTGNSSETESDD